MEGRQIIIKQVSLYIVLGGVGNGGMQREVIVEFVLQKRKPAVRPMSRS